MKLRIIYFFTLLFGFSAPFHASSGSTPEAEAERLEHPADITPTIQGAAMPLLQSGRIGDILNRYYEEGMGGQANWAAVESLRVNGEISLPEGTFPFSGFQKKPNLAKIVIRSHPRAVVLGFDGSNAWRELQGGGDGPQMMDDDESRRFRHGAIFGNHLIHPYAEGKEIFYIDTVPVDGSICHQIRVVLASAYQTDFFIDIRSYFVIKSIDRDLKTGLETTVVYSDYFRQDGLPVARKMDTYEGGKWVSTLKLTEARLNTGVMPWMFKMPE